MTEEKEFYIISYDLASALWSQGPGEDLSGLPKELERMAVGQECFLTGVLKSKDPDGDIINRHEKRVNDALGDKRGNYELTIISERGYSRLRVIRK